jgi:hypothetical protein
MPAKAAAPAKKTTPLADLVDELGALEKEYAIALAPFEMKLARMKALKALIQEACTAKPADEWVTEGAKFGVRLGPAAKERSINFSALVKKIGAAAFAKFATCTLGALEKHASADVAAAVVTTDLTGPRKLSTFEKGSA